VAKSARPQNLEPSHAVKIVRQLLTFVKGTRVNLFPTMLVIATESKIYSSDFGLDLIAVSQSSAVLCTLSSSSRSSSLQTCSPTGISVAECVTQRLQKCLAA
jgi:hypothetical protein